MNVYLEIKADMMHCVMQRSPEANPAGTIGIRPCSEGVVEVD